MTYDHKWELTAPGEKTLVGSPYSIVYLGGLSFGAKRGNYRYVWSGIEHEIRTSLERMWETDLEARRIRREWGLEDG